MASRWIRLPLVVQWPIPD